MSCGRDEPNVSNGDLSGDLMRAMQTKAIEDVRLAFRIYDSFCGLIRLIWGKQKPSIAFESEDELKINITKPLNDPKYG